MRIGEIPSDDQAQRWLVQALWGDSSVGVIGGAPKCSKTWLGLDLALSVATGTACLGKYAVPQPGPVLVYLAEDALPIVRERVAGMARHRGLDLAAVEIHVITAPTLRLDREPHRSRLFETARRLRPRLLLLDPLVRLHAIDENHAGEVAGLLAYFRSLQRQLDLSVMLVHHTRKNAAGGSGRRAGTARFQRHPCLRRLQPLPATHQGTLGAVQRASRRPAPPPVALRTGRDRCRDDPPGSDRRDVTTRRGAACRTRCWTPGTGRGAHPSQAARRARASRTNGWARPWSRSSEPAASAARRLAGDAATDLARTVPVPPSTKEGNGTMRVHRAAHRHRRRNRTVPGVDFDRLRAEITMEQVLDLLAVRADGTIGPAMVWPLSLAPGVRPSAAVPSP